MAKEFLNSDYKNFGCPSLEWVLPWEPKDAPAENGLQPPQSPQEGSLPLLASQVALEVRDQVEPGRGHIQEPRRATDREAPPGSEIRD